MAYLGRLRQRLLSEDEAATQQALVAAMMNIESVADVIETDMVDLVRAYLECDYEANTK